MYGKRWGLAAAVLALTAGTARARQAAPLLQATFEENADGWIASGEGGKIAVTHDAGKFKTGKGALQFDYKVEKDKLGTVSLLTPDGKLAKMKSLRFWVKADHTTPLIVSLHEKDGGNYRAIFTVPNAQWQQIELTPDDFILAADKTDPKDPDGKLDLDKVDNVNIADLDVMLVQIADEGLNTVLHVEKGAHTLLLDDFTVRSEPLESAAPVATKKLLPLDGLWHPQMAWVRLGEVEVGTSSGKPLNTVSLKATYHQSPMKFIGLLRGIPYGKLEGMDTISFSVASAKFTKLLIQLEERDGGKYNAIVEVPGDKEATDITQAIADFKAADDSKDANTTLDLEQVKSILIMDISGFTDNADGDNTLWIGRLRATAK